MNQDHQSAHLPRVAQASLLAAALASLLVAPHADAALFMGQTLGYQYLFPDHGSVYQNSSQSFTVGDGVELPALYSGSSDQATVDLTDVDIVVDYYDSARWSQSSFNGFRIYDINGTLPAFTSVTINAGTNMAGFNPASIQFDADNIYVNWQGLSFDSNTIVSLRVTAVPEPSVPLLGAPAAGGLLLRRRRR